VVFGSFAFGGAVLPFATAADESGSGYLSYQTNVKNFCQNGEGV